MVIFESGADLLPEREKRPENKGMEKNKPALSRPAFTAGYFCRMSGRHPFYFFSD
jgi:hypothetical protein